MGDGLENFPKRGGAGRKECQSEKERHSCESLKRKALISKSSVAVIDIRSTKTGNAGTAQELEALADTRGCRELYNSPILMDENMVLISTCQGQLTLILAGEKSAGADERLSRGYGE